MARKKDQTRGVAGWQHLKPGDVITVLDSGEPVKCRVLFCVLEGENRFHANLEVIEGDRKGERFPTVLKAGAPEDGPGGEGTD